MGSRAPMVHRLGLLGPALIVLAGMMEVAIPELAAQEELIVRPGPPAVDNLETDANKDGIPDGWYNARDVKWMNEGGAPESDRTSFGSSARRAGRPSRLSLAFGVDGRKTEAIVIGLWVRLSNIQVGERQGEEPGLFITLSGEGLRAVRRASLGPWTHIRSRSVDPGRQAHSRSLPAPRPDHDGRVDGCDRDAGYRWIHVRSRARGRRRNQQPGRER